MTLLHFSDYHSHAVPFDAGGRPGAGGIARAIGYLKPLAGDASTLVLSGGDTLNAGSPAWSDKYRCAEWSWWNGIVAAAAYGNHDADYGPSAFAECRESIRYPILAANVLGAGGRPLFPPSALFRRAGVTIGVFAVAGPDFDRLVGPGARPESGATFTDRVEAARRTVADLRGRSHVNAVVLIGHEHHDDDVALAKAVPGIDLILGTHSHLRRQLERIPGTSTWTISPGPYLTDVARVTLTFEAGRLTGVEGALVPMSPDLPEDPEIAARVASMSAGLKADPRFAELFRPIGTVDRGYSTDGALSGNSPLGGLVADAMREAARADVAMTTASSIREPIPSGELVEERLRAALPYPNRIVALDVTGALLSRLLAASLSRAGSDLFAQTSGVQYHVVFGKPADVLVGGRPLSPDATYRLATTDFLASVAEPYRSLLSGAAKTETGLDVRDAVRKRLTAPRSP